MATKADFTGEEWKAILASPMLAAMAVTLAEPNGLWGLMKESFASGKALLDARSEANSSTLAKAIVEDFASSEGRTDAREALKARLSGRSPDEMKRQILEELGQVARIADAKSPGDALAFKLWLVAVAQKVAEASTEGGFLGFGGVPVSAAEKATIAEVKNVLGSA